MLRLLPQFTSIEWAGSGRMLRPLPQLPAPARYIEPLPSKVWPGTEKCRARMGSSAGPQTASDGSQLHHHYHNVQVCFIRITPMSASSPAGRNLYCATVWPATLHWETSRTDRTEYWQLHHHYHNVQVSPPLSHSFSLPRFLSFSFSLVLPPSLPLLNLLHRVLPRREVTDFQIQFFSNISLQSCNVLYNTILPGREAWNQKSQGQ